METKPKQKAKRVIKELDFSTEGCAVSLVGPSVQGAANGFKTLVFKSGLVTEDSDSSTAVVVDKSDGSAAEVVEKQVEPSGSDKQTNKETKMDEKETVEALQKSMLDQQVLLTKALEQIKTFEAEKKEAIAKSRKAEVLAAVKDADKVEVLFKAVADASDEDFKAVVKALSELTAAVDKSDLFVEKGVQTPEQSKPEVNHVEALLKAKYAAK